MTRRAPIAHTLASAWLVACGPADDAGTSASSTGDATTSPTTDATTGASDGSTTAKYDVPPADHPNHPPFSCATPPSVPALACGLTPAEVAYACLDVPVDACPPPDDPAIVAAVDGCLECAFEVEEGPCGPDPNRGDVCCYWAAIVETSCPPLPG